MDRTHPQTGNQRGRSSKAVAPWRSRWPEWAGHAAAVWSGVYGVLGLWWALGGAAFPFGVERDPDAKYTLLKDAQPTATGIAIAFLGLAGTAVALAMSGDRRPRGSGALIAFAWTTAAALTVVIPDYRPLLALVRIPGLLLAALAGWLPEGVGFSSFIPLFLPWPVVNQILLIVGGLLWAATAVAFRRRSAGSCPRCGFSDDLPSGWTSPESAARWGRWAVAMAVAVPAGYAATRWAWALGIPLGMTRRELDRMATEMPGVWWAGALVGTLGLGGAVLTLGLVQRWGEIYPRWIPRLRGRPVRPRAAIVPATLAAILMTTAGLMQVRIWLQGGFSDPWVLYGPQLFWPLWGAGLGAATFAYHLRRRVRCATCRRV